MNSRKVIAPLALATALSIGTAGSLLAQDGTAPSLILSNGQIYTASPDNPHAEAVAIQDNRIVAVGSTKDILAMAGPSTQQIDLKGKFVVPGLNDAHYHSFSNAPVGHQIELPWEPTWEQVLEAVEKATKDVPEGTWILGLAGVDVIEDLKADRFSLDKIAPNHPVYISTWFSHGEVMNTNAMNIFGVDENAPDPLGGWHIRDAGSDKITGKFHEYVQWPLRRKLLDLNLSDEQMIQLLKEQTEQLLKWGVTSIQDMPIVTPERYLRLLNASETPIRVRYMRMPTTTPEARDISESADVDKHPFGNDRITASGTKWFLDGTPMERVAATRKDYADKPGWKGRIFFDDAEQQKMLSNPDEWRDQLLLHCHGDRCAENVMDNMEAVSKTGWPEKRLRIEHGDGIVGDLIPRAAELGIIVVQQPHHLVLKDIFNIRYGEDTDFLRLRSLIDAGIPLAFGTEGLETPYAAFPYSINHPLDPNESITRAQVIDAFTSVAAFAEMEEGEKGQIKPGMLADIAVLSQNLLEAPAEELEKTESLLTIIDGEIVYDAGKLN
ncbi:amidohydrolase [Pseudovibrio denitrificans]|uniref:amidohydrolase n=1 Tax=Pseudovibrio denitrificans TaxID=258256 RepID=UPI0039BEF37E